MGSATLLAQAVAALREDGPSLGRPLVDRLKGSRIHHLKELRPGSRGRSGIRIIFAFDPTRRMEQPEPEVLVWRTPAGRTYVTAPTVYPA